MALAHLLTHLLTHSLTHSILINLFNKVVLNIFSLTSPTKYYSCPKHFLALFGLFIRVLERGKFLSNKMAELVTEVEDGFLFHQYTGIPSWVENREFATPRSTSCDK